MKKGSFGFEKLQVYQKAKALNGTIYKWLKDHPGLSRTVRDQLGRACLSILLHIAEGAGRFTKADQKNFFVIARSSAFECVAIFDFLLQEKELSEEEYDTFYESLDEISRMLFSMIKTLDPKINFQVNQ